MKVSKILISYGSQTGTAEDVAERITREALAFQLTPSLMVMNSISLEEISSSWKGQDKAVIFVCSTTGQGDTPDNMKLFWKLLCRRNLPADLFSDVNVAVIALGDSSYEKFNFVGKKLMKRLKQLGANAMSDVCLGDDQHDLGPDAAVDPWLKSLWQKIISVDVLNLANERSLQTSTESKFIISSQQPEGEIQTRSSENDRSLEFRHLISTERVTPSEHFQDVRLITIDLKNSAITYDPGDVLMILPSNLEPNIKKFFELFPKIDAKQKIFLRNNPKIPWANIPVEMGMKLGREPWSWESIVTNLLDIQSVPRRYFFELLSSFTPNELEKEKLEEFSRPEGQQDLFSYCNRPKRNILEVLQDFRHATENIPIEFIFDLIPMIKPRAFSIASSMRAFPSSVQILVAIVKYSTKLKTPRYGLCSNWIASLSVGAPVLIWTQKGSFNFPPNDKKAAVIMVGPGTGCAPFRSFISHGFDSENTMVLFFGCRNRDMDFYFQDEWSGLNDQGHLKLFPAFSRPTPEQTCLRQYVQNQIKNQKEYLQSLMMGGEALGKVYIYVAGNAKQMPIDVMKAFEDVFSEDFVKNLFRLGFYQTEVWS